MAPRDNNTELEWKTRKTRIDPRLDHAGWPKAPKGTKPIHPARTEEEETSNGPADFALWVNGAVTGIVEAKKVTLSPQEVLRQAERYAKGVQGSPYNYPGGYKVPFLYATNGEIIWFKDARRPETAQREVAAFHTPDALREMLGHDFAGACERVHDLPHDHPRLRPYQKQANAAVEAAIANGKHKMLVAMATGTGKTYTLVNQIYRLMKAGVVRRVLFLVDRRALAAQAVRAFASFEAEPGKKFDQIYEVYSNRFQREDFGEEEKFDPKLIPEAYLTRPSADAAFVYVSTIQRMAINILGREAIFDDPEGDKEDGAGRLDIPIHAFDLVVADECHRGYTGREESVWRDTLNHFDGVKVGLTATPAAHTMTYFKELVYRYGYEEAVRDGYLCDYDVVKIRSEIRVKGLFLKEGERIENVDTTTGARQLDLLEDERAYSATEIEQKVTAPDSNRKIIEEVKRRFEAFEAERGRTPKTLIFAVNDLPHRSHADQLVQTCREVFNRGDDFVSKITGRADRPLQRIREFRNRPKPAIAVTVDLMTTGVDIPDLEFIVFLRMVKSRILFEQMVGRGTRKGEQFPDKDRFYIFDCFDGTLMDYFAKSTGVTEEPPVPPTRTLAEIIDDIANNRDRDFNTKVLVKRLHRIDKSMSSEARDLFAAFVPNGDVAAFARELPKALKNNFTKTMALLQDKKFQDLLLNYPRPKPVFFVAPDAVDLVAAEDVIQYGNKTVKPEDYITAFEAFVQENADKIDAMSILMQRPRDWSTAALSELRDKLAQSEYRFTVQALQRAHQAHYRKALVDVISMVKHAANHESPLLTAQERAERAMAKLKKENNFNADQLQWLDRIQAHLIENLAIEVDHFEIAPIFERHGGLAAVRRAFGGRLEEITTILNEAVAA